MSLLAGCKLLVADDSVTVQKVVDLTFSDEGCTVIAVGDGRQALEEIERSLPDIVLADVTMPGANGYEVCARIKRDKRLRHIAVILLVGAFENFNEAEARESGADDVLTKPFQSIREMVNKVGNLFGGSNREVAEDEHEEMIAPSAKTTDQRAPQASLAPAMFDLKPDTAASDSATAVVSGTGARDLSDNLPSADTQDERPLSSVEMIDDSSSGSSDQSAIFAGEHSTNPMHEGASVPDIQLFDDDDRNIEITPLDEEASSDSASMNTMTSDADNDTDDFSIEDPAQVHIPAEPDFADEDNAPEPHATMEAVTSDDMLIGLPDSSHAPATASADTSGDTLLDLDDLTSPALTIASPSVAEDLFSDSGLLDLPDEKTSHAASATQDSPEAAQPDQPPATFSDEPASERIPLDEVFPPEADQEGTSSESMLTAYPESPMVETGTGQASTMQHNSPSSSSTHQITLDQLAPEVIEEIVRRVVEQLSERAVQEIAWEVVPALAERMIKRRLETDEQGL